MLIYKAGQGVRIYTNDIGIYNVYLCLLNFEVFSGGFWVYTELVSDGSLSFIRVAYLCNSVKGQVIVTTGV